jgi:phage tail P2-like protein
MDLNNIDLLDLQTSYMKQDPTTIAMCKVLTPIFRELAQESKLAFIYGRIDELDDKTLDELAWQFHVDFYSVDFPIHVKRNLIKDSKRIHRLKGTPLGVEHLLSDIFGSSKLVEWFEYDGEPFMFKVKVDVENNINLLLDKFEESINSVKNTRSHLEKIEIYTVSKCNTYIGSTTICGEEVTVLPWSPKDLLSKGSFNIAIGNSGGVENITLYPKKEVI